MLKYKPLKSKGNLKSKARSLQKALEIRVLWRCLYRHGELTSTRSQEKEDMVALGRYRSTGSSKKMHSIRSRQTPDV